MGKVKNWTVEKKDAIEKLLITFWAAIGMDIPNNYEDIVQYCYEDVCETADPINWSSGDVAIAFRRWIEAQAKPIVNHNSYFKIIKQGFNDELKREEIQVHCGENANLFLIKTNEGFIVDVYNQDENVNTMTVWEDDLTPIEDDEDREPTKQEMFDYLMNIEFGNDRARDYDRNVAYLNSLTDEELKERYEKVKFEVDHQD
jgi:hypothetical protein